MIEITDNFSHKLGRLDEALGALVMEAAAAIVDDARAAWPISGDSTPSVELLGLRQVAPSAVEVFNEASYATEIHGGDTVAELLDAPLAEAAEKLGREGPRLIGEALRG